MIMIISPTTTMDFTKKIEFSNMTTPYFEDESLYLIKLLRSLDFQSVSSLMNLSSDLTNLNIERYKYFGSSNNPKKQSIVAFDGEVFNCMNIADYTDSDFEFANNHLRILSGLYGLLLPTDTIEPYRLEMKAKLDNSSGNDLYKFWKDKITKKLIYDLTNTSNPILVNLASSEYIKSIDLKNIKKDFRYINVIFKDFNHKSQTYKVLGLYSKKARGN